MVTLPVRKDYPWDKIHSWRNGNGYCICFIYPHPDFDKSHIVKGGSNDVERYLSRINYPILFNKTWWYKKHPRGIWHHKNVTVNIRSNKWNTPPSKGYTIYVPAPDHPQKWKVLKTIKRHPRKWIKELNPYILI